MPPVRLPVALLVAAIAAPLSGCFTCEPQLDVHHCSSEMGRCDTTGESTAEWNPDLRDLFPDIDRLVRSVDVAMHGHATWSEDEATTFWQFYHVPLDREDKQVYLWHEGKLFHVRVLEC